jgi:hypothetical protein
MVAHIAFLPSPQYDVAIISPVVAAIIIWKRF